MRKVIKIIFVCAFCFARLAGNTQIEEVTSFYFSEPQPASLESITEFGEENRGLYRLEGEKYTKLKVEKDSIFAKYFIAFQVTIQEIDSNENLYIKDELLYGVAPVGLYFKNENDTLLVALNQEELYCDIKSTVVKKQGDTYYLNRKESENRWRTIILEFSGKYLNVMELEHSLSRKEINKVPKEVEFDDELKVLITTPTDKQFFILAKSKGYRTDIIRYKKD